GLGLALTGFLLCFTSSALASEYAISGYVEAQGASTMGIPGASVLVKNGTTGALVASATTDLGGGYAVIVPTGTYDVTFTPHVGSEYGPLTIHGQTVIDNTVLNVTLIPDRLVRLSGVLVDGRGDPVAGAGLVLGDGNGGGTSVVTGADGSYSLLVAPGSY